MALPCKNENATPTVDRIVNVARNLRNQAQVFVTQCDAGSVNLHQFAQSLLFNLATARAEWPALIAVPGVLAELQARFPNKTIVSGDLTGVQTAMDTLIGQIEAGIPVDANDWIQSLKLLKNGAGGTQERQITNAGTLATFKTNLQAFQAAFDVT